MTTFKKLSVSIFVLFFSLSPTTHVLAQSSDTSSPYVLSNDPQRPRNYWLPPLASFFLPGLDQFWEQQYLYGGLYAGVGLAGIAGSFSLSKASRGEEGYEDIGAEENKERWSAFFGQLYNLGGGFSAYHSFRTAAYSRQKSGKFAFLDRRYEESPADLSLSAFRFDYLARWTTLIPVGIAASLAWWILPHFSSGKRDFGEFGGDDAYFSFSQSYLAGTWEEPAFRGFLMPALTETLGNKHIANIAQATVFALAHYDGKNFWKYGFAPRFGFGLWAGWVSQYRNWTVSEPIFIHFLWNTMVFVSAYSWSSNQIKSPIRLELLNIRF